MAIKESRPRRKSHHGIPTMLAMLTLVLLCPMSRAEAQKAPEDFYGGNPRIWVLSDLALEVPITRKISVEIGFGWYGIGGGLNLYTSESKNRTMISLREGAWLWGTAVNAEYNFMHQVSKDLDLRIGIGLEYFEGTDSWFFQPRYTLIPIASLSFGIKL